MADAARQAIEARQRQFWAAVDKDDFDAAVEMFDDDAILLPHKANDVQGKSKMKEVFQKMVAPLKPIVMEDVFYFEMFTDDVALSNTNVKTVDESGNTKLLLRICQLWKKKNGAWYVTRDMFNGKPLP